MTLFFPLITIFFVILVCIVCYKKELFNKTQIDGFELLLFKIIMPSYLFAAAYKNDLYAMVRSPLNCSRSFKTLKSHVT